MNDLAIFYKIVLAICLGILLFYFYNFWDDSRKHKKDEEENYIFRIRKTESGITGNRFVKGDDIRNFLEVIPIGEHLFADYVFGLGMRNQMEWHKIKKRYDDATALADSCLSRFAANGHYFYRKANKDIVVQTWDGETCYIYQEASDKWNSAQQQLKEVHRDFDYFINTNYNLDGKAFYKNN